MSAYFLKHHQESLPVSTNLRFFGRQGLLGFHPKTPKHPLLTAPLKMVQLAGADQKQKPFNVS